MAGPTSTAAAVVLSKVNRAGAMLPRELAFAPRMCVNVNGPVVPMPTLPVLSIVNLFCNCVPSFVHKLNLPFSSPAVADSFCPSIAANSPPELWAVLYPLNCLPPPTPAAAEVVSKIDVDQNSVADLALDVATSNFAFGSVVPMPTLPDSVILIFSATATPFKAVPNVSAALSPNTDSPLTAFM